MTMIELAEAERGAILKRLRGRPLKKKRRVIPDAVTTQALREAGISERDAQTLIEGAEHERRFLAETGAVHFRPEIPDRVSDALGVLQEQVSSDVSSLALPVGWTERTARQATGHRTFLHEDHGSLHVSTDGGKWSHHDAAGVIRGSGVTPGSLTDYLRGLKATGDRGGNTSASDAASASGSDAAAESLDTILARVRGGRDTVPAAAHRLIESRVRPRAPDLSAAHALVRERLDRREAVPVEAHNLVESLRRSGRLGSGSGSGSPDLHTRLRAALAR
jgi:hypothetical protein